MGYDALALGTELFTIFPLLANPQTYEACRWDLVRDAAARDYWLGLFRSQFRSLMKEAIRDAQARGQDVVNARARIEGAREAFVGYLDVVRHDPDVFGRLDIHQVCLARQRVLGQFGFDDPYLTTKARENRTALAMLPAVLAEIDAMSADLRPDRIVRGVFAGNIFDLGAIETIELFRQGRVNFPAALNDLKPRPWLVDDLDPWVLRMERGPAYRAAVLFVDNAGCDVLLGMFPLARDLILRGTRVILTANTAPALNDITHDELVPLIQTIAGFDPVTAAALDQGTLTLVPSGNGSPLIDLAVVSPELGQAVTQWETDLVVLEGMGRAIESNYDARFSCDVLKLAMIKDRGVAQAMGGQPYDLVCRFEPGPR